MDTKNQSGTQSSSSSTTGKWQPQIGQKYLFKQHSLNVTVDRIENNRVYYHSEKPINGQTTGDMLVSDFLTQCQPLGQVSEKAAG